MTAMVTDSESQPSRGGKSSSKIKTSWKIEQRGDFRTGGFRHWLLPLSVNLKLLSITSLRWRKKTRGGFKTPTPAAFTWLSQDTAWVGLLLSCIWHKDRNQRSFTAGFCLQIKTTKRGNRTMSPLHQQLRSPSQSRQSNSWYTEKKWTFMSEIWCLLSHLLSLGYQTQATSAKILPMKKEGAGCDVKASEENVKVQPTAEEIKCLTGGTWVSCVWTLVRCWTERNQVTNLIQMTENKKSYSPAFLLWSPTATFIEVATITERVFCS